MEGGHAIVQSIYLHPSRLANDNSGGSRGNGEGGVDISGGKNVGVDVDDGNHNCCDEKEEEERKEEESHEIPYEVSKS